MTVIKQRRYRENQSAFEAETNKPKFPAARYFQIHFEHMESQLDAMHRRLEALQQQMAELQLRLNPTASELDLSKAEQ